VVEKRGQVEKQEDKGKEQVNSPNDNPIFYEYSTYMPNDVLGMPQ
jgi:hypothetical protein